MSKSSNDTPAGTTSGANENATDTKRLRELRVGSEASGYQHFDLDRNIGFLVSDTHRLVTAVVDKVMEPLGLTRSQLRVLLFLIRQDGYTQVELAEKLEIGKVAIGGLLDRLEEKELLERKNHPDDRRAKRIYLTPKVEGLFEPMSQMSEGLMDNLLLGISPEDQEKLSSHLIMLKENCHRILAED